MDLNFSLSPEQMAKVKAARDAAKSGAWQPSQMSQPQLDAAYQSASPEQQEAFAAATGTPSPSGYHAPGNPDAPYPSGIPYNPQPGPVYVNPGAYGTEVFAQEVPLGYVHGQTRPLAPGDPGYIMPSMYGSAGGGKYAFPSKAMLEEQYGKSMSDGEYQTKIQGLQAKYTGTDPGPAVDTLNEPGSPGHPGYVMPSMPFAAVTTKDGSVEYMPSKDEADYDAKQNLKPGAYQTKLQSIAAGAKGHAPGAAPPDLTPEGDRGEAVASLPSGPATMSHDGSIVVEEGGASYVLPAKQGQTKDDIIAAWRAGSTHAVAVFADPKIAAKVAGGLFGGKKKK